MAFKDKLDLLIKTFNSNNSKLARAINVDPSLVSRWRSGERTLSVDSPYTSLIVDYFISIDSLHHKKNALRDLLKISNNIYLCGQHQLKKLLTDWIFEIDIIKSNSTNIKNKFQTIDINNILIKLNSISLDVLQPEASYADDKEKDKDKVNKGEPGYFEVFWGQKGKKQVIYGILSTLLAAESPVELYLCDETDMDWLVEDRDFFLEIFALMKQLVTKGHKITIIHNVNRSPSQIVSIMDFWIPLFMTGGVDSYYSPKYSSTFHKKTLCVARDTAAIISININDNTEESCLLLTSERQLIRQVDKVFMCYLASCRPLIKIYNSQNISDFYYDVYDIDEKVGSFYALRNRFTTLAMPDSVYSRILDGLPLTAEEKTKRLNHHVKYNKNFKKNIRFYKYVEIINIDEFEKFIPEELFKYDGFDFNVHGLVKCEPEHFITHLMNAILYLKKYDNYEMVFIKLKDTVGNNRVTLTVKEETIATISSCDYDGNNRIIMSTSQSYIVEGMACYLAHLTDYIPDINSNKSSVIKKLEKTVSMLKEWNRRKIL